MSVNLYNKETKELTQVAGNAKDIDAYTKAETDDLLDEKADIDNFEIYSTTETKIGTWIDGKPIYRKVIPIYENSQLVSGITPIPDTDYEYTGGIPSNIDKILDYNVPSLRDNIDPYVDNFTGIGVGPTVNFVPRLNGTFYFNPGYPGNTPVWCYCILEYTKTTD